MSVEVTKLPSGLTVITDTMPPPDLSDALAANAVELITPAA